MKINILKNIMVLLILAGSFAACTEKESQKTTDTDTFLEQLKSIPLTYVSKESLPEWLIVKINEIEAEPAIFSKVWIYKCKWNNQVVYFILNTLSSCMLCDVYYEDGKKQVWSTDGIDANNFCLTNKDWQLIYEYGNNN